MNCRCGPSGDGGTHSSPGPDEVQVPVTNISREQAEDFLFTEAALLDEWRLQEWIDLFTQDGEYMIPSTDQPNRSPAKSVYLVYDDRHRLAERALRLLKRTAHVEFPHSKTRRIVSNVRILENGGDAAKVACNFVAYRTKNDRTEVFPGHSEYHLISQSDGSLRIRKKLSVLDLDTLRDQGKLSILI
jgi:p-cumate 2,3-dioxygenase beta subunit